MITAFNIAFLAGGLYILSELLRLTLRSLSGTGKPTRIALTAFMGFPALLLTAAVLSSLLSPESPERYLSRWGNAAAVAAGYLLLVTAAGLFRRRRRLGRPEPGPARSHLPLRPALLPFLICALAVVLRAAFPAAEATKYAFAFLLAAAAVASLPILKTSGEPLAFLLAALPYLAFGAVFVISPEAPEGDSLFYHAPAFDFIARSFAAGRFLPPWLPQSGGIRIGIFHTNLFFGLPQKAAGYFIYSLFPLPLAAIYKIQHLLGVLIFSLGWWLVLRRLTDCRRAAYLGVLMITLGGTGITFHQEQAAATAGLLPWFVLALLNVRRSPLWIFPVAAFLGLGLALHYPQIQSISFFLAALALGGAGLLRPFRALASGKKFLLPSLLLTLSAAGPAFYLWHQSPDLSSGLRGMDVGERPRDPGEYRRLQRGASSASPLYFRQYYSPRWEKTGRETPPIDVSDRCGFFVGRAGLVLAAAGLVLGLPKSAAVGLLFIIFSLLTLGINSPIPFPEYFFRLGVPFFDVFRQWVHFFPMVNYSLSLLAAVGAARLLRMRGSAFRRAAALALAAAVFLQVFDTAVYGNRYLSLFPTRERPGDLRDEFFQRSEHSASAVFQYRNRFHLNRLCGDRAIPEEAILTAGFLNLPPGRVFRPDRVCSALADHPEISAVVKEPEASLPSGAAGKDTPIELSAGFAGAAGSFPPAKPGLAVTPLNLGLDARAFLDGRPAPLWTVNAALSGVPLRGGETRLEMKVNHDVYLALFLYQWLLFLGLAACFLRKKNNPS